MNKLVDSLGLNIFDVGNGPYPEVTRKMVKVSELQAALEKLPKLYGQHFDETFKFSGMLDPSDTHVATVLCIEEIKMGPLKHEFETEAVSNNEFGKLYTNMIPSSFVGKKVRVTVEEVRQEMSEMKPTYKKLHELIELAENGVKFKARITSTKGNDIGVWCEESYFIHVTSWAPRVVQADWEYIEHKEPRNITFSIENGCADTIQDETKIDEVFRSGKWKVVCTEVLDENE